MKMSAKMIHSDNSTKPFYTMNNNTTLSVYLVEVANFKRLCKPYEMGHKTSGGLERALHPSPILVLHFAPKKMCSSQFPFHGTQQEYTSFGKE